MWDVLVTFILMMFGGLTMIFFGAMLICILYFLEDEGFNEMEKRSLWRKRAVQATISINPYRNIVIEEIAQEVEKMQGFGKDTIDSLTVYIREMKA